MMALPFQQEQLGNARLAEWRGFGVTCPQALVFGSSRKAAAGSNCTSAGVQGLEEKQSNGGEGLESSPAAAAAAAPEAAAAAAAAAAAGAKGQCSDDARAAGSCTAGGMYAAAGGGAAVGAAIDDSSIRCCAAHSYTAEVLAEYVFKVSVGGNAVASFQS
jgi:hypothetical protein